ncbi:non-hydrolyzing UDP-N-acetylglucosamine 2-epimerase [uncultured Desulfovibrio sp.]|uniref:non-hydrolyzing UDP-N-acetylglucosamine 2-epimerase n=2 Tax=uncultured Desulfovibrio sp. TaxID=167968 RepID=UPI0026303332|nr:UDP-N-acetylglucosamine 2-epimerase (non-hydrolyzing) [uncultured Desulfovibrio sp.]
MKIMTVLGTRPEIIRLSRIIALLDTLCEHVLVFTGQNYDPSLSSQFFEQLEVRPPDYSLHTRADSAWAQIGNILAQTDALLVKERPQRFLVLGDTNSALTAQCAKRRGIAVYHMEAGNRCFDDRVPEEVNRRVIDHASDVLLPYTNRSRDHLLREGFHPSRIYVTGNPIREVMNFYAPQTDASDILQRLGVARDKYFLVTLHRAENVDVPERLHSFMRAFATMSQQYGLPVLLSLHPRTRIRLEEGSVSVDSGVRFIDPPGFFDFVHLEKHATALLSDSGTVQEEGCILGKPTVTLRDVTERPETLECGSNILTGCGVHEILRSLELVLKREQNWNVPAEYQEEHVSHIVGNILTGYRR